MLISAALSFSGFLICGNTPEAAVIRGAAADSRSISIKTATALLGKYTWFICVLFSLIPHNSFYCIQGQGEFMNLGIAGMRTF
ncbi:MAG: hypothetical protein K9K78_01995 [Spirochaetales bacterium]|nr:hypothetical protein [Spirochaetales bacterium]